MDAGEVEGRTAARRVGVADAVTTAGMTVYAIVFQRIAFGLWMLYHEAWEKLHTWTPQTLPRIVGMWAKNPEVVSHLPDAVNLAEAEPQRGGTPLAAHPIDRQLQAHLARLRFGLAAGWRADHDWPLSALLPRSWSLRRAS